MHIASQWVVEHFLVESLSTQSEAITSSARGSHETSGFGLFFSATFIIPFIFDEKPDGTENLNLFD